MLRPALLVGVVEAGRVVRNPLLWVSMVPAIAWAVLAEGPADEHFLLTGYGLAIGWFASMTIAAAAVRRTRRALVSETLDSLPDGADVRTLGVGFGAFGAVAVGFVVTCVVWVVRAPAEVLGTSVDSIPRGLPIPRPTVAQFVQGPLVLLVFASLGVLIGRWIPSWLLLPFLFVPVLLQFLWFGVWNSEGTPWYRWLLPVATGWVSGEWIGACDNSTAACDLQVSGFDRITPWWHAGYLVALAALLVSIAVALDGSRAARRWVVMTAAATLALGAVQVLTYERWGA
jgi:hypothetical protein